MVLPLYKVGPNVCKVLQIFYKLRAYGSRLIRCATSLLDDQFVEKLRHQFPWLMGALTPNLKIILYCTVAFPLITRNRLLSNYQRNNPNTRFDSNEMVLFTKELLIIIRIFLKLNGSIKFWAIGLIKLMCKLNRNQPDQF